jgi:DNA helicase INO80
MLLYWRKNEKDELAARKKAEKEALDKAKAEEEAREAKRQSRKLNFLLTQTELYSHFIGKKIKTAEAERGDADTAVDAPPPRGAEHANEELGLDDEGEPLPDIDYDDGEAPTRFHGMGAVLMLLRRRGEPPEARCSWCPGGDQRCSRQGQGFRCRSRARARRPGGRVDRPWVDTLAARVVQWNWYTSVDGDELNFQNPSLGEDALTITQPKMLMAQLKEYQLKGLTWLGNLYEQGINGILADEMGLGKVSCGSISHSNPDNPDSPVYRWCDHITVLTEWQTIQSISLLAFLAEHHNLWGPFLVIAPSSTLHNWQQELARFVPRLKALPYWGSPKDRETLRRIWCRKNMTFNEQSPFHILVTSYQLVRWIWVLFCRLLANRGPCIAGLRAMYAIWRAEKLTVPLGRARWEIPQRCDVAVHGPRRGAGDQVIIFGSVEESSLAEMPEPTASHRYSDPEFDARWVYNPVDFAT